MLQPDVLEALVQAGADLEAKTKNGETPLDICEDPELRERIIQLKSEMETKSRDESTSHKLKRSHSSNTRSQSVRRTSIREKSQISRREAREEGNRLRSSQELPQTLEVLATSSTLSSTLTPSCHASHAGPHEACSSSTRKSSSSPSSDSRCMSSHEDKITRRDDSSCIQVVVVEEDDSEEAVLMADPALVSRISLRKAKDDEEAASVIPQEKSCRSNEAIHHSSCHDEHDVNADNDAENRQHRLQNDSHQVHVSRSSFDSTSCASSSSNACTANPSISSSKNKGSKDLITITNGQTTLSEGDSPKTLGTSSLSAQRKEDVVSPSSVVTSTDSSSMASSFNAATSGTQKVMMITAKDESSSSSQHKKIKDVLVGCSRDDDPLSTLKGINNKNKHHHNIKNNVANNSAETSVSSSISSPNSSSQQTHAGTHYYYPTECKDKDLLFNDKKKSSSETTRLSSTNMLDEEKSRSSCPTSGIPSTKNNNVIVMNQSSNVVQEEKECHLLLSQRDNFNSHDYHINRLKNNNVNPAFPSSSLNTKNCNNKTLNGSSNSIVLRNNFREDSLTATSSQKDKTDLNGSSSCHSTSSSRDSVKVEIHVTVNTSNATQSAMPVIIREQQLNSVTSPSSVYHHSSHASSPGTLADLKKHRSDQRRGSDRVSPSEKNSLIVFPAMNSLSSDSSLIPQTEPTTTTGKVVSGSDTTVHGNGNGHSPHFLNNMNGTTTCPSHQVFLSNSSSVLPSNHHHAIQCTVVDGSSGTHVSTPFVKDSKNSSFLPIPDSPSNTLKKFRGHEVVGGKTSHSPDFSKHGCCTIS